MEILILLFAILFAVFAWLHRSWATALVIALLPVYQIRFDILGVPATLLEVMIVLLFVAWFVQEVKAKNLLPSLKLWRASSKLKHVMHYPFYKEIIVLLVIAFISLAVSGFSNNALGIFKAYFLEPIMFFIVAVNVWKIEKHRPKIFIALAVSALIVSLVAVYQAVTGNLLPADWVGTGRVTGVFVYPNALGLYLGPIVLVLFGWLLSDKKVINYEKVVIGITILLSIIAIYLAKSEGALIGVAAALFIFGVLYNKQSRYITAGVVVVALAIYGFNNTLRHGLNEKVLLRDLDGQIRRQLWNETTQMLNDGRSIGGAGLANYQQAVAPFHQEGIFVRDFDDPEFQRKVVFNAEYKASVWQPLEIYLYPHNIWLNFWSELGFYGLFLFLWLIIKYLAISLAIARDKKYRAIALGLAGAMIVVVVHGLVDVPYFKNDLSVMFWLLVAMLGVLQINKYTTNKTN